MKLRLEGTADELKEKAPQIVKALAARLGVDIESLLDMREVLEKAEATKTEPTSHYGPIRDLVKESTKAYKEEMATMVMEINEVLDQAGG